MTRADSHFKVAGMFNDMATTIQKDGSLLLGYELTPAEAKSAAANLRAIARHYESLAHKNQNTEI